MHQAGGKHEQRDTSHRRLEMLNVFLLALFTSGISFVGLTSVDHFVFLVVEETLALRCCRICFLHVLYA